MLYKLCHNYLDSNYIPTQTGGVLKARLNTDWLSIENLRLLDVCFLSLVVFDIITRLKILYLVQTSMILFILVMCIYSCNRHRWSNGIFSHHKISTSVLQYQIIWIHHLLELLCYCQMYLSYL